MTLCSLKDLARALFLEGVRAADPAAAVRRALLAEPIAKTPGGRLLIIAFGKASCAMMGQALHHVPAGQSVHAIAVPNYENAREIDGCRVMPAGHPLPDQNGIEAGMAIMELLRSARVQDQVLCLISGGGSALVPAPREGLTLEDKIAVNQALLSGGFDIGQMNCIRQQLSILKGGGLLALAHPAQVRSLIISDVVGDDLQVIASGPTVSARNDVNPVDVLKEKQRWDELPQNVKAILQSPKGTVAHAAENLLVCTNSQSLHAMADFAPDWHPHIVAQPLVGDVRHAAQEVLACIRSHPQAQHQLIIWGGETTVNITGKGRGGRNQELAVRVAQLAGDLAGEWVFLSGGTDGRDGPTDAAGGIVDRQTLARAQANNINVTAGLQDNDSYRILEAGGGLLTTGATGTNVADIQVFLRVKHGSARAGSDCTP